jgi:neutral ceramidase
LPVLRVTDAEGHIIALLFSVSCHPTSASGWQISAEHPGAAMRLLNERLNTEGAMFLQGCAGDTKARQIADGPPDDTGRTSWRAGTLADIAAIGRQVANEVEGILRAGLTPVAPVAPRGAVGEAHLPLQALPSRAHLEETAAPANPNVLRRAWAIRQLQQLDHFGVLPETAPVLVQSLTLAAGVELLGLEGEVVSDIGHLILAKRAGRICFPMGYSNGAGLYIPSERMMPHGGYEVDCAWIFGHAAPLATGFEAVLAGVIGAVGQD